MDFANTPAEWDPQYSRAAVKINQVESATWLHAKFGHLDDFAVALRNEHTSVYYVKDNMLEWLAIHFPEHEAGFNELQRRIDQRPCLETDFEPRSRIFAYLGKV